MSRSLEAASGAFVRGAAPDTSFAYMGGILSFLVSADDTGGGLTTLVAHSRRGSEPPPHIHLWEHEITYVLDGEIAFFVEDVEERLTIRGGQVIFLPRGKAHAMYFLTPEIRILTVIQSLDGHRVTTEPYLKQMALGPATSMELPLNADRYATASAETMERAVKLAADNGMIFTSPEETTRRLPSYPGFGANRLADR